MKSETNYKSVADYIAQNLPLMDTINRIAFFCLGITTAWTANQVALEKLQGVMPNYHVAAGVFAVLIALIIAAIFDFGLRKNFILSLLMFNSSDFKSAKFSIKLIVFGFLIIAVFRFCLSGGATFISSIFISDELVEDADTRDLERMLSEKEKTKQDITLASAQQIENVRNDANRRAKDIVNAAINAGGKRWADLWRKNNSWIRTVSGDEYRHIEKWRANIQKAEKEAQGILSAASEQIAAIQSTSAKQLEAESNDRAFATITRLKENQFRKLETKESLTKVSLWMVDGVMAIIAILTSFGLAFGISCHESYELFREETTLLDVSREGLNASKRIVLSYLVALVARVDRKAYAVANNLSGGAGSVDLKAKALGMQYKSAPNLSQSADSSRLPIGASFDIHEQPANKMEWIVGTAADTSADSANTFWEDPKSIGKKRADKVPTKPAKRVADTVYSADTSADKVPTKHVQSVVINTEIADGIPYVEHVGKDGKTILWTERDVNKNRNTYAKRMEEAKRDGKEKVYQNNKEKVELMDKYLLALSRKAT